MTDTNKCPECGQEFNSDFTGIDLHWHMKHENVMPYEEARSHILEGTYDNYKKADNKLNDWTDRSWIEERDEEQTLRTDELE